MAAVNQHQQLYLAWASVGKEGVEGCARGAAGIKHVVDQHDLLALDGKPDFSFLHHRLGAQGRKVIPVKRDIERAYGYLLLFDMLYHFAQPLSDGNSATPDPDQ